MPKVLTDPAALTPIQWAARRAAFAARGRSNDDPEVIECREALAYWRCRKVIDAQRDQLNAGHVPALADMLRHPHRAVSA